MTGNHDPVLVSLSVAVAVFASYTALVLAGRVSVSTGTVRRAWLIGGSLAMGIGIWSMHFIGMLAFRLPVPIAYDVPLWGLSAGIAVAASLLALFVVSRPRVDGSKVLVAGLGMGAAIAGMHYTGMAAMRIPGRIGYDAVLVALSVAIAVAASFVALWLAFRFRAAETWKARRGKLAGGVVMGLAISGMHYTAMAAARFVPAATRLEVHESHLLATDGLTLSVVVGTLGILTLALLGAVVDRRVRARLEEAEAVRRSESRFRALIAATTQIVWTTPPSGEFETQQFGWSEFTGQSFEQLKGWGWLHAVHPEDRLKTTEAWTTSVEDGQECEVEHRLRGRDGEYRHMLVRAVPVRDEGGAIREWVGIHLDISARRRAEEEREENQAELEIANEDLQRSHAEVAAAEAHYRRLVETSPYAIYAVDREGRFTELNPAAGEILGTDPAELIGRSILDVVATEDGPGAAESVRRKLSGEVETSELELRILQPSGELRLVHIRATAIREDGQITGSHGIARDITDERAREEQNRLLAAAVESLSEGVCLVDAAGRVQYANHAYCRIFGCNPEDLAERGTLAFLPEASTSDNRTWILETVREEGGWTGRVHRRRLDGEVIPLEMIVGRVEHAGKELFFAICRDVTEDLAREQQLRRAERLASVGTLVGGVAHELNNPLHAIRSFAELMLMEEQNGENREALEIIKREADRAAQVVSDLRLLARETQDVAGARVAVDLNDVVRHVLKIRRYALNTGNVEVRDDLAEDLPPVLADRGAIEQVVLNLVVNAEQAMTGQQRERRLIVRTRRTSRGASVHVVDTGPGIPPQHLERIFDPFFTTKAPGEGTGLGLSLAHSIVTEHGGQIDVDSEPGKGTAFRIDVPRAPTAATPREDRAQVVPARPLRILVVDDEDAIRRVASRFLERLGHRVDTAADGGEALHLLSLEGYDVILSDVKMPGLGGEDLLAHLRARHPGLERRLVFITGDVASGQTVSALAETDVPVLAKPVHLDDLARAVEHIGRQGSMAEPSP